MRTYLPALLIICLLFVSGCARLSATFRVVDAETQKPIEGAVAIAWWSSYRGLPGLSYGVTDKVIERETGPDGTFKIPMIIGRLARQVPRIKVYKPGYVGWDNRYIYLGCYEEDITLYRYKEKEDFKYKSQDIYLVHWKDNYSFMSHFSFLNMDLPGDLHRVGLSELKYEEAVRNELPLVRKERKLLNSKVTK